MTEGLAERRPQSTALPAEIGFLADHGHPPGILHQAALLASLAGVTADEALLKHGLIGEAAFYRALAAELEVPFLARPHLSQEARYPDSLQAGLAPLALPSGGFVAAPRGAALIRLLTARQARPLAITTPTGLRQAVFRAKARSIADRAASGLREALPDLATDVGYGQLAFLFIALTALIFFGSRFPAQILVVLGAILSPLFFGMIVLRIAATFVSNPLKPAAAQHRRTGDADLPVYTIIAALYREKRVAARLIQALSRLDYPAAKLDIKLVLEADDRETWDALCAVALPGNVEIVVAPQGSPRTKPRALNVALPLARGRYTVVYDAEDIPDPGQLRLAVARFAQLPRNVACLQARLTIDNTDDTWLTRLFTIVVKKQPSFLTLETVNQMTHTLEDSVQGTESYELPMKIGHSFLRVSHQEQIKGYGIERQIEQRDEICRKRGITLVETYGNTTRAVSARKGKQRTHGDLGRFFDDLGRKIKPGEYFLVENLDRLSREDPLEAWRHFDAIIVKGVTVITTTNDREYSAALIKNSPWLMHELLGEMQRAHSENEYRSKRIGDARTRSLNDAAKTGKKVSRICPAWLKPIEDDKRNILGFEPVPDRLLVVQRIFELAASGMGQWSIANVLNEPKNKVPPFSTPGSEYDPDNPPEGRWRAGYIGKIISSQSVLGHYVPRKLVEGKYINLEPMLGYYGDPIVELSVFVRANGFRENRDQTGEARQRRGKTHANLFNQICFCASCGSQLLYKTYTGKHRAKGEKGLGKKANTEQSDTTNNKREPRRYLYCERAKVGDGCDKKRAFNLGWLEETVLNNVPHFPLDELFDGAQNSRELRDMDNKIAEATLKLDGLTKQRSNVMELMRTAETPDEATLWRTDLHKLMGSIKTAENNIAALNHKRTHVEASLRSGATAKETIAKLTEELKNPDQGSRFVIRQKLSNLLKTYISQIRFDGENDEITVILHELGLIGYKFWAGKKGGAPKKNPMKLIDSFDLRSQLGDRATGGISPEVFTTNPKTRKHDAGLQNTFDKLVQAKG